MTLYDFSMTIEPHFVKNFWPGRDGYMPMAIVEHMMQGTLEQTRQYFNGEMGDYPVSAHYGIGKDGRIWQFVRDEDTAWANGVLNQPDSAIDWLSEVYREGVNANLVTLAIEYEGFSGEELPQEQYEAALSLHRRLLERWEIPVNAEHILGHDHFDSVERKHNPGPAFPWSRLLHDLNQSTEIEQPEIINSAVVATPELAEAWSLPVQTEAEHIPPPSLDHEEPEVELVSPEASDQAYSTPGFAYQEDMPSAPDPIEASSSPQLPYLNTKPDSTRDPLRELDELLLSEDLPFAVPSAALSPIEPKHQTDALLPDFDDLENLLDRIGTARQFPNPADIVPFELDGTPRSTVPLPVSQAQSQSKPAIEELPSPDDLTGLIMAEASTGLIAVDLVNIRTRPSFDPATIMRTAAKGTRFHFDGYRDGPELQGGRQWLHIIRDDGSGWLHSRLVDLEKA